MCGIAGLIGCADTSAAVNKVSQMMDTLERRGPDGQGVNTWSEAVLGHRRLAIFDLSAAGHQPMLSPDLSVGIVFNGAIYNFRELRGQLEKEGLQFRSQTDTEVLINGYLRWGIEGLVDRIEGMFAFGLWDGRNRKLFLVRDRLGVKPLVYVMAGRELAFASTVRALRAAGLVEQVDDQAISDYLEYGFVTEERTIYRGARKVPAASIVEWSEGNVQVKRYWSPPHPGSVKSPPTFNEAVDETERLFLRAVEKRLFADVPVGALLSGGIDSSLVCWAIAKLGHDLTAYTVGTPGDRDDESEDARTTAANLGIRHKVLDMSAANEPDVSELVNAYTEPFACASALGMLNVSRAVAGEATVLITGDGGDDVFLGYPEHRHLWFAERLARATPRQAGDIWRVARNSFPRYGKLRRLASFLDYSSGGLGAVTQAHDGLPAYVREGVLGERLAGASVSPRSIPWSPDSARQVLSDFLEHDLHMRFVAEYLTKVDGSTMHYSLEARSPFLDHQLWEFASALPYDLRLHGGRLKAVLRELARRKLGGRLAGGRKRGFSIPVRQWIAGRWRPLVEEAFRNSILEREGWINSDAALRLLKRVPVNGYVSNQIWYLFVLENWFRQESAHSYAARSHPPISYRPSVVANAT